MGLNKRLISGSEGGFELAFNSNIGAAHGAVAGSGSQYCYTWSGGRLDSSVPTDVVFVWEERWSCDDVTYTNPKSLNTYTYRNSSCGGILKDNPYTGTDVNSYLASRILVIFGNWSCSSGVFSTYLYKIYYVYEQADPSNFIATKVYYGNGIHNVATSITELSSAPW